MSGSDLARANSAFAILGVLRDLMQGGRHARRTVARAYGVSLPTADRWLGELAALVPGMVCTRVGQVTWWSWAPTAAMRRMS